MKPFSTVEEQEFKQIFKDIPTVDVPLGCRTTVTRRLKDRYEASRLQLKEYLKDNCRSISFSLDAWTSANGVSVLGIVGHWLADAFRYVSLLGTVGHLLTGLQVRGEGD